MRSMLSPRGKVPAMTPVPASGGSCPRPPGHSFAIRGMGACICMPCPMRAAAHAFQRRGRRRRRLEQAPGAPAPPTHATCTPPHGLLAGPSTRMLTYRHLLQDRPGTGSATGRDVGSCRPAAAAAASSPPPGPSHPMRRGALPTPKLPRKNMLCLERAVKLFGACLCDWTWHAVVHGTADSVPGVVVGVWGGGCPLSCGAFRNSQMPASTHPRRSRHGPPSCLMPSQGPMACWCGWIEGVVTMRTASYRLLPAWLRRAHPGARHVPGRCP